MWLATLTGNGSYGVSQCKEEPLVSPQHEPQSRLICERRIGELREEMEEMSREQCDYDPVSGETYEFDRYGMTKSASTLFSLWSPGLRISLFCLQFCLNFCHLHEKHLFRHVDICFSVEQYGSAITCVVLGWSQMDNDAGGHRDAANHLQRCSGMHLITLPL